MARCCAGRDKMDNEALALAGYRASGMNSLYFGEFEQSKSDFESILRVYDRKRHSPPALHYVHDPRFYAIAYLPVIHWIQGFPSKAAAWQRAAMNYASELNQAVLNTHVRIYGGAGLDELVFNAPSVRGYADAIVELADQHNLLYFRLSGLSLKGWAMARQGEVEDGLALMRESATERLETGVTWYQILYLCMLAESYLQHCRVSEGLQAVAEARELVARTDEHMWVGRDQPD